MNKRTAAVRQCEESCVVRVDSRLDVLEARDGGGVSPLLLCVALAVLR
eukprot:SAG31_NODE_40662_length_279_cov_1.422222_1_plen_47_part_10